MMILSLIYIAAICAANYSVYAFGPVVTPVNAFLFIGLDFVIRDKLHEKIGVIKMIGLISIAGGISYTLNPATSMIAIASVAAFTLSSTCDAAVYQALIRKPWHIKSNGSNIAAAGVDSLVFPLMAFGAFMPQVVIGQFLAKVCGGAVWSYLLRSYR